MSGTFYGVLPKRYCNKGCGRRLLLPSWKICEPCSNKIQLGKIEKAQIMQDAAEKRRVRRLNAFLYKTRRKHQKVVRENTLIAADIANELSYLT